MYANADCSGEPVDSNTIAFGECQNGVKVVSCADGVLVQDTFTTDDCTGTGEVQTMQLPSTSGECFNLYEAQCYQMANELDPPVMYFSPGQYGGCPTDSEQVSQADCYVAARAIADANGYTGDPAEDTYNTDYPADSFNHVPFGCTWSSNTKNGLWNENAGNEGESYFYVCQRFSGYDSDSDCRMHSESIEEQFSAVFGACIDFSALETVQTCEDIATAFKSSVCPQYASCAKEIIGAPTGSGSGSGDGDMDSTQCAPGCRPSYPGDGVCDSVCDVEECGFDLGDCDRSVPTVEEPPAPTRRDGVHPTPTATGRLHHRAFGECHQADLEQGGELRRW